MKKLSLLRMAFLSTILLMSVIGCATIPESPIVAAQLQQGVLSFEGEWTVSDWQVGGNKTYKYDGTTVKIVKRGDIYTMDGPDQFFAEARFKLDGTNLKGLVVPDVETLRKISKFPTQFPTPVLAIASGKIVYHQTLTMLEDGRVLGEEDNWEIFYRTPDLFDHVNRVPGHFKFVLKRKS